MFLLDSQEMYFFSTKTKIFAYPKSSTKTKILTLLELCEAIWEVSYDVYFSLINKLVSA